MAEFGHLSAEELVALPLKSGFRQRGVDMTRLETFTDAAFAFAVTLLVVGGGDAIPQNFDEMIVAMKQIPAFAASFANIMLFWYAHHIWSRRFGLDDSMSAALSMLLIFVVLIYVYPLKAIYSGALASFSEGYFVSYFQYKTYDDLRRMFTIFGLGYASLSGVIVLLNRHALRKKNVLGLNALEVFDTRTELQVWIINMVIPAISIAMAMFLPDRLVVIAGMFYSVFGVVLPLHAVGRNRLRIRTVAAEPAAQ